MLHHAPHATAADRPNQTSPLMKKKMIAAAPNRRIPLGRTQARGMAAVDDERLVDGILGILSVRSQDMKRAYAAA